MTTSGPQDQGELDVVLSQLNAILDAIKQANAEIVNAEHELEGLMSGATALSEIFQQKVVDAKAGTITLTLQDVEDSANSIKSNLTKARTAQVKLTGAKAKLAKLFRQ